MTASFAQARPMAIGSGERSNARVDTGFDTE
jgi:hypothetical protein